jgi:hypothetical protein
LTGTGQSSQASTVITSSAKLAETEPSFAFLPPALGKHQSLAAGDSG